MRFALLLCALLLGCAPEVLTPNQAFAVEGVDFTVAPRAEAVCGPDRFFAAQLSWNVRDMDDAKLDIRVGSSEGKLFARVNGNTGTATTERWVNDETWFVLVDRNTGQVLAAAQSTALECPQRSTN